VVFTTVAISSNLHQILASGSGNGFRYSFNGFVSATEQWLTGTLTVTLTDWTTDSGGPLTMAIGVVARRQ